MSNWGIPDWQIAEGYSVGDNWSENRWRWEFFRRRSDLRDYFDARAGETYEHYARFNENFPKSDEPGFGAIVDVDARERFGYSPLPNPRIGDQPETLLMPHSAGHTTKFVDDDACNVEQLLKMADVALNEREEFMFSRHLGHKSADIAENEHAVIFHLEQPLEPQIERARQMLRWEQKERLGKIIQRRQRPNLWPAYLRVIDARADGATWQQISQTLPGHMGSRTPQDARRFHEQATGLMINF